MEAIANLIFLLLKRFINYSVLKGKGHFLGIQWKLFQLFN